MLHLGVPSSMAAAGLALLWIRKHSDKAETYGSKVCESQDCHLLCGIEYPVFLTNGGHSVAKVLADTL